MKPDLATEEAYTQRKAETGQSDAFFVPERRARSVRAKSIITVVRDRLKEWEGAGEKRRRARRPDDQFRHELMVEALVCDALRRNIVAPGGAVAVSLSKAQRSRYEPKPYKPMRALLEALSSDELKILTFTLGQKPEIGRGRRTTISVGPALTDMAVGLTLDDFGRRSGGEPIILRQAHQRVAQYGGVCLWKWHVLH